MFGQSEQGITRQAFDQLVREMPEYSRLEAKVGAGVGAEYRGMCWDQVGHACDVVRGQWCLSLRNPLPAKPSGPSFAPEVKARGNDFANIKQTVIVMFDREKGRIEQREKELKALREQAQSAALRRKLDKPVEVEPIKSPQWEQVGHRRFVKAGTSRGEALKYAVEKDVQHKPAYEKVLDTYATKDGSLPLGRDATIVFKIYQEIVKEGPHYRGMSTMTLSDVPYPSSVGGSWLLKTWILGRPSGSLPRGDLAWADWAMFHFGGIMNAQPFPDGNKRIARTVYALMILSGGMKFQAPSDKVGAELAHMR